MLATFLKKHSNKLFWLVYPFLLAFSVMAALVGGVNIPLFLLLLLAGLGCALIGSGRSRKAGTAALVMAIIVPGSSLIKRHRVKNRLRDIRTEVHEDHVPTPNTDHPLTVVDIGSDLPVPLRIAVQAGVGMYNRKHGGPIYTHMDGNDPMWMEELKLEPDEIMTATEFLDICMKEFPRCVRYSYEEQQTLVPNILTVGAVLEAIPIDVGMDSQDSEIVFDATETFRALNTPHLATEYVYFNYVNDTTGLAMLNPGYSRGQERVWDPEMVGDIDPYLVDFIFSNKLFVIFLVNGCIECTRENTLLNDIMSVNPWPKPIGVFGYANYWNVLGGYLYESQTLCANARNMGAIPTDYVNNLSFFSNRRKPITAPGEIQQNELEDIAYNPTQTYVAFVVGDGDNVCFIMESRANWIRERAQTCLQGEDSCPPLTWTISPHLLRLAPDVLEWYYEKSYETGKDYFMLPPSGYLYAYPASMERTAQDAFVEATERDARLLGTKSTVHWEWLYKWRSAEGRFLPKYGKKDGAVQGIFPVNVPYMLPTFTWKEGQFYKILEGKDGGKVVLFRPREWRGIDPKHGHFRDEEFYLSPENMAKELAEYPRGTVTGIYMTSDGGLNLSNSVLALVKLLPDHVHLVSADTAVRLALEAP